VFLVRYPTLEPAYYSYYYGHLKFLTASVLFAIYAARLSHRGRSVPARESRSRGALAAAVGVPGLPHDGCLRDQRGHHVWVHVARWPPVLQVAWGKPRNLTGFSSAARTNRSSRRPHWKERNRFRCLSPLPSFSVSRATRTDAPRFATPLRDRQEHETNTRPIRTRKIVSIHRCMHFACIYRCSFTKNPRLYQGIFRVH